MENKIDNNVGKESFDVELKEYQDNAARALEGLVEYLRSELKTRSKDFVLFKLDEIANGTQMDKKLKKEIIHALENPEKEFIVNFKQK